MGVAVIVAALLLNYVINRDEVGDTGTPAATVAIAPSGTTTAPAAGSRVKRAPRTPAPPRATTAQGTTAQGTTTQGTTAQGTTSQGTTAQDTTTQGTTTQGTTAQDTRRARLDEQPAGSERPDGNSRRHDQPGALRPAPLLRPARRATAPAKRRPRHNGRKFHGFCGTAPAERRRPNAHGKLRLRRLRQPTRAQRQLPATAGAGNTTVATTENTTQTGPRPPRARRLLRPRRRHRLRRR